MEEGIKIYQISRKIKKFKDELFELNIIYNEAMPTSPHGQTESIIIENTLRIILNVDNAECTVWGAVISITGVNDFEKEKRKVRTHEILEKMRKENDLEWKMEILKYFE